MTAKPNPTDLIDEKSVEPGDAAGGGLAGDTSLDDPGAFRPDVRAGERGTVRPAGPGDAGPVYTPPRLGPAGDTAVSGYIAQLSIPNEQLRADAVEALTQIGEGALPQLLEGLKHPDQAVRKACEEAARKIVEKNIQSFGLSAQDLGSKAPLINHPAFLQLIADADRLSFDPQARQSRADYVMGLAMYAKILPGVLDAAKESMSELVNPLTAGTRARIAYADALATNPDAAKTQLIAAMQVNPGAVIEKDFLQALSRHNAKGDPVLMQVFTGFGGDAKSIPVVPGGADVIPFNPIGEKSPTSDLWNKFGFKYYGENFNLTPDERMRKYENGKTTMKPEDRVELLADHFLTAKTEVERRQAMERLKAEAKDGNATAQTAIERLPLLKLAFEQSTLKPWSAETVRDTITGRNVDLTNRKDRLDFIQDQMKVSPIDRDHHAIINALVHHYFRGETQHDRDFALEILRKEVQNGNLSGGIALRQLATADACLRLAGATADMNNPQLGADQRTEAKERQMKAMKDLAAIDHAERRIGETSTASGRALDYLTRSPVAGVNPDDVKQAAAAARTEANQKEAQASELFTKAVAGAGPQREQSLAQLKEMAETQFKTEKTDTFMKMYRAAVLASSASDATANLHDPAAAAQHLAKLSPLIDTDYATRQVLNDIKASGDAGAELVEAIRTNDTAKIETALKKPGVSDAVRSALKGQVESIEKYQQLTTNDALTAFARPEQLEELRRQAQKDAAERQQKVDDLVATYLHRDTAGTASRQALASGLPADGPMKLTAEQNALKQQLARGLELNAFTPAEAKLIDKLVKGEQLTAEEVRALRTDLATNSEARRAKVLEELKQLSKDHVHVGNEFEPTLKALESISNAGDVHKKADDALRILKDAAANPQARNAAVDALIRSLEQMERWGNDGYHHQLSTKYLRELENKVPGGLKPLLESLRTGTPAQQLEAIEQLKKHLPDGSGEANEFRALRIVRDLGPESSSADFERARKQLEAEIADSKDAGKVNARAEDWHRWTSSAENITRLSTAAKDGNAEAAKKAVDDLIVLARTGDPYARAAVAAILTGNTDNRRIGAWMDKYPSVNEKPLYVPNLNNMPEELRRELAGKVAEFYTAQGDQLKLNQMEATSLAYAVARAEHGGDKANLEKLTAVLEKAVQGSERAIVLSGIRDALITEYPGTKALGAAYLKGIDDPVFAKHFNDLRQLAVDGNEGAMRIMAAVAAGRTDNHAEANPKAQNGVELNSISRRAQSALDAVGAAADHKGKVVDAMLYVDGLAKGDGRFTDNHRMLASMGKLASELSPQSGAAQIEQVRNVLRARFEEGGKKTESASSKSALEGMMHISKYWKKEDAEALSKNLNPAIVEYLRRDADKIPSESRAILLEASKKLLTDKDVPLQDRLLAIETMSAFAKHLTKQEVELLASFGGDEKVNRGGVNGEKKMQDLGISSADDRKAMKSAVADALMNVMFKAKNERPGVEGPRETAFAAFRDLPWPIKTGVQDGKPVFVESRDSKQLTEALVNYAKGRPFDLRLAEQINRVVDNAKLPQPAGAIMLNMGFGDPKNPFDPRFLERAEKIVSQYENFQGMSGDDVVRRVASNIALANSLPGSERAKLMGWDKLSEEDKQILGWVKEPPEAMKRDMGWDQMTEKQKDDFRWQGARVSSAQVFGEMYNGMLQKEASYNAALLGDMSAQADALRRGRAQEEARAKGEADAERAAKKENMDELEKMTKKGVSFGSKVWNTVTFNNARDDDFDREQTRLARNIDGFNRRIAAAEAREAEAKQAKDSIELSRQVGEYHRLLNSGEQVAADKLAIKMWADHGPALKMLAPSVWNDLTVPRDATLQGQSLLQRLQTRGMAQWDSVPSYEPGEAGFKQALGLQPAAGVGDARGLMQLKPGEGNLDTTALRNHMLGRLNEDPALKRVSALAREMNEDLSDLSKMFGAAMSGTKYEAFIDIAKQKASHLKDVMAKVTRQDLYDMTRRIDQMEKALAEMKKPGAKPDQETVKQLEKMIETYKGMHNMLNKFDKDPKYPEVIKPDDKGVKHNPHKQIADMVKTVTEGGLKASTFTNWVKENALTIGLTIAACAATVAACATLGVGSPVAVGLWVAVAGLAAREVSSEIMYHANKGGYTGWGTYGDQGAKVADWYRKMDRGEFTSMEQAMERFGKDVAYPYAKDILRDWAAFVVTAGLSNYFFGGSSGVGESLKALVKSPPPNLAQLAFQAERAALAAQGNSQAASFMRQFLKGFGPELWNNVRFTAYQMGLEGVAHEGVRQIDPELMHKMGEWGQFGLSFALSTALAMGQGYKHGKQLLQDAKMGPNNTLEFKLSPKVTEADFANHMRQRGFEVKQVASGRWEVLPFNAKPGTPPMYMENASRGEGKPPVEVEPPTGNGKQKPVNRESELMVTDEHIWQQSKEGQKAIEDLHAVGEKFVAKDYDGALALAQDMAGLPKVEVTTKDVKGPTAKEFGAADPVAQQNHLESMLSRMSDRGKFEPGEGGAPAKIEAPRPVMEFEVRVPPGPKGKLETVTIDLTTGKPIGDKVPPAVAAEAKVVYDAFAKKNADFVTRLKAERALVLMEEKLHLMQSANGDKPISPRFAEYVRDMAFDSGEHTNAFNDKHTARTREQEIILALHDAGWPLSQIEHHFGAHHSETRAPVFEYLRAREAINNIPEQTTRELVNKTLEEASPAVRRQMLQHMEQFCERNGTVPAAEFKAKFQTFKDTADLAKSTGRLTPEQFQRLYEQVTAVNEAIDRIPNQLDRELVKDIFDSSSPEVRMRMLEHLPGFIERNAGASIADRVESFKQATELISGTGTSMKPQEFTQMIDSLVKNHADIVADPAFKAIADRELSVLVLSDSALFDPHSFKSRLDLFDGAVSKLGLPQDSLFRRALERRVDNMLAENRKPDQLPLELMSTLAKRYDLTALADRIKNYKQTPPKGMTVDNRDVIDAFLENNPHIQGADKDFHVTIDRLLSNLYANPNELSQNFGKKKSGKPVVGGVQNMKEALEAGTSRFVFDVGGNAYRMVADIDFSSKPPKVHVVWAGTHAQYDRISVGELPANYKK